MWRIVLVLSCLLAAAASTLATPDRIVDHWSVQEGLPNNALSSILQSRDGYLWIATWAGIVQFDGVRFAPVAENLPNSHARVLFEDSRGAIWIGVAGSGLSRWTDGRVETYTPAAGLAGQDVRAVAEDRDGRIWAGTENGVTILDKGRMRTLRVEQGLPRNTVTGLAAAPDGRVWIATTGGLCVISSPEPPCERVKTATGAPDVVFADRAGRIWIGSGEGLTVLNNTAPPLPSCPAQCLDRTPVTAVMETRDGDLWVGLGGGGAARLHRAGIDHFGAADGLPAGNVVTLAEDAEGSVWIGVYNGGLARITRRRVATFSTRDGLPGDVIGSIVQDRDGTIWAGTQCGPIARLQDGRFVPQLVEQMRGACAWVLWPARDGSLWIGTRGSGLYRWDGRRLDHFDRESGLSDPHIAALFEDRDGVIWIGTEYGGVHTFQGGHLSRAYGRADGVATGYIASFAQDRDGRVWIGSNANGLSVFEHGRFRTLTPAESPPTRNIAGFLVDSRGDLWIGSAADGLFRRRNGRYERFGPAEGLGDRLVAVLLEDTAGNLWVSTTRGISRLERARIEAVADGRATSLAPIVLDRSDGMRNTEGSGGGLDPSGLRDRAGRLWFSTIDGIAVVDPQTLTINRLVPQVRIESAAIGDRPAVPAGAAVDVPPGSPSLEFAYTAFSFVAPAKVRFRYRLAGFDDTWHDVGARRVAYFSRLPPGAYTFEVLASNNDGVWSSAPAAVRVVVRPFFWERRAVQGASLALLVAGAGLALQWVLQRRALRRVADLERERALERERSRIARDLHDDLGSRLAHIALMADAAGVVPRVSDEARAAVETLDELVWTVNARNDTANGFAAYASRFAEEHVSAAGLRLRLRLAPDLAQHELTADARRHLYLAFKEAVTNAVKHAQASEIQVAVAVERHTLSVEVADNGRGLTHAGDPTGNGMANMRERMQAAGGSLDVGGQAGGGTRVSFRVPIAGTHLHVV